MLICSLSKQDGWYYSTSTDTLKCNKLIWWSIYRTCGWHTSKQIIWWGYKGVPLSINSLRWCEGEKTKLLLSHLKVILLKNVLWFTGNSSVFSFQTASLERLNASYLGLVVMKTAWKTVGTVTVKVIVAT